MEDLVVTFPILEYFSYEHLPDRLQIMSKPFWDLAFMVASMGHENRAAETASCLRKLLEAKDCAVRSIL